MCCNMLLNGIAYVFQDDNAWVMHGAEFHKEKEAEVTCVKMMIFVYLNVRLHVWLEYIIGNEMACVFKAYVEVC